MNIQSTTLRVKLYKPMDYQRAVHNGLAEHWRDGMHFVKAVRQCGKSLMASNILLQASLNHKNQTSILVSPTLKQAREVFKTILKVTRNTGLVVANNATSLEITFVNFSQVLLLSAEQGDNLRGYTVTAHGVLIIDEAAYISDSVFYLCTPFVNANRAPILAISTPKFKSGFFYDFYKDGEEGKPGIYSYDFTKYYNPFLTPERLEMYRTKMPLNLFRADYLGEWMEATSDLFGNFSRVMSNTAVLDGNYTAGLDWGVGKEAKSGKSDSTSIALFNGQKQQVLLRHWNDLDETATVRKIADTLKEWSVKKLVVETNSIGAVYLGLLRKEISARGIHCAIREFTTTNDSKRKIIEGFIVDVQNAAIQLLDDPILKIQMSAYEMQKTPSGKITYNASSDDYHDDCIIATALALHGTKQAQYSVR